MDLHPDFRDLLAEFARCAVSYVVLGGYAVGVHAEPRATKDLDLLVSGDGDNLERVARALGAFGAPRHIVEAAGRMTPTEIVYLGAPPVRIDILRSADGIDTEETIARAGSIHVGTLVVPIISRGDLIANKKASGRAQDLADVAALERV